MVELEAARFGAPPECADERTPFPVPLHHLAADGCGNVSRTGRCLIRRSGVLNLRHLFLFYLLEQHRKGPLDDPRWISVADRGPE
jgi:hypothetical protein